MADSDQAAGSGQGSFEDGTWKAWIAIRAIALVEYAGENPKDFLAYFFLFMSPIMICSAILSYMFINELDKKKKKQSKKKKAGKQEKLASVRRKKPLKAD